jgi:peptidyl-prolyl cis-trans isomerase SurA
MARRLLLFLGLALIALHSAGATAGVIVDRIVATVNGHIILQSDWGDAIRYEAFIAGRKTSDSTVEDRKAALDRLIDQELLKEQMHANDFPQATEEEIAKRLQDVRKLYPEAKTPEEWQAVMAAQGVTEAGLKDRIAMQLNLMRLVDSRLRPNVNVDNKSIESYYNQELLPQLLQSGAGAVALSEVSGKIKELLTEQKVNQLLVAWLQNLRAGSQIHTSAMPDAGSQTP